MVVDNVTLYAPGTTLRPNVLYRQDEVTLGEHQFGLEVEHGDNHFLIIGTPQELAELLTSVARVAKHFYDDQEARKGDVDMTEEELGT